MITKVTPENLVSFLSSKEYALILFDADWNKRKELVNKFRQNISELQSHGNFAFGEIDTTAENQVIFSKMQEWQIANIPAIVYFYGGQPMKTLVGVHNIVEEMVNMVSDISTGMVDWE